MRVSTYAADFAKSAVRKAPPRSVFMAIVWIAGRTHPLIGVMLLMTVIVGWSKAMRDG